jgi:hypothetical protein
MMKFSSLSYSFSIPCSIFDILLLLRPGSQPVVNIGQTVTVGEPWRLRAAKTQRLNDTKFDSSFMPTSVNMDSG